MSPRDAYDATLLVDDRAAIEMPAETRRRVAAVRLMPPWSYWEPEFLALERDLLFRRSWQLAGHVSEVAAPGDYLVHDCLGDSVMVLRGRDGVLRAFMNACRHRGYRLLEGRGSCAQRLTCPYHGWSYGLDGRLGSVPMAEGFPKLEKAALGLRPVDLETFEGFLFVRIAGDGPSVAELMGDFVEDFRLYRTAEMQPVGTCQEEVWDCNWKIALDNYLEVYHVPIGHPGFFRLTGMAQQVDVKAGGATRGIVDLTEKPSKDPAERRYQQAAFAGNRHLPAEIRTQWRNYSLLPNLGFDFFPEGMSPFQVIPLAPEKTLIRMPGYGLPEAPPETLAMRREMEEIGDKVNLEDRDFVTKAQAGLKTAGYRPGPLNSLEVCTAQFHDHLRARLPLTDRDEAPSPEEIRAAARAALAELEGA